MKDDLNTLRQKAVELQDEEELLAQKLQSFMESNPSRARRAQAILHDEIRQFLKKNFELHEEMGLLVEERPLQEIEDIDHVRQIAHCQQRLVELARKHVEKFFRTMKRS